MFVINTMKNPEEIRSNCNIFKIIRTYDNKRGKSLKFCINYTIDEIYNNHCDIVVDS